jgi:hypothetical protein
MVAALATIAPCARVTRRDHSEAFVQIVNLVGGAASNRNSYPSQVMRGLRYLLRNFTAVSVREHLRSQVERAESGAELTPNEIALVDYAAAHSQQLSELADKSRRSA